MVATGHNLDDEAAVLFGNVLRWDADYLGRQQPVLPAADGFVKKVKPLVRLGEREMAAYCILRGIDYQVEECPNAVGNKHLGYKEALNAIEEQSPGTKNAFYFGFLARAADQFAGASAESREDLVACPSCGSPTTGEVCAFCKLIVRVTRRHEPGLRRRRPGAADRLQDASLPRDAGAEGEFHTHAGFVRHDELIGQPEGVTVRSTAGARYLAVRPTLSDFVLKMPRGAQVIYPKDLGPILLLADIFPGARVLEAGVGSGALSMTLLRAGADVVGYELRADFKAKAEANVAAFLGAEALERYRVEERDVYDGIDETDLDRIVLDLPEPWRVVKLAEQALHPGGILVSYLPTIIQVVAAARGAGREPLRHGGVARGAAADVARRRPVGAPRPPDGGPHRFPDRGPPRRRVGAGGREPARLRGDRGGRVGGPRRLPRRVPGAGGVVDRRRHRLLRRPSAAADRPARRSSCRRRRGACSSPSPC